MSKILFADPSLLTGAARILDFAGQFDQYNMSGDVASADRWANYSDWLAVARDLNSAMAEFEPESAAR